jgi:hypothetical protein
VGLAAWLSSVCFVAYFYHIGQGRHFRDIWEILFGEETVTGEHVEAALHIMAEPDLVVVELVEQAWGEDVGVVTADGDVLLACPSVVFADPVLGFHGRWGFADGGKFGKVASDPGERGLGQNCWGGHGWFVFRKVMVACGSDQPVEE